MFLSFIEFIVNSILLNNYRVLKSNKTLKYLKVVKNMVIKN